MATPDTQIIAALAAAVLLWIVYHACWQRTLLDSLRQKLFSIRDEMFIDAAEGPLSFDDVAYGMIRTTINQLILSSDRFTFTHLIFAITFRKAIDRARSDSDSVPLSEKIPNLLNSMQGDHRAELYQRYLKRTYIALIVYILCWTPVVGILFCLLILALPIALLNPILDSNLAKKLGRGFLDNSVVLGTDHDSQCESGPRLAW